MMKSNNLSVLTIYIHLRTYILVSLFKRNQNLSEEEIKMIKFETMSLGKSLKVIRMFSPEKENP